MDDLPAPDAVGVVRPAPTVKHAVLVDLVLAHPRLALLALLVVAQQLLHERLDRAPGHVRQVKS